MEKQLVTLAIHTYEKAQILKTLLESEGIATYIHNVNQIQPVISAGVRIRIKESDLPRALRLIEDTQWLNEDEAKEVLGRENLKKVLIPVDFSDYSIKACEIGINHAHQIGAEVMLLHAYFSTYIPSALPFTTREPVAAGIPNNENIHLVYKQVQKDIENICTLINRKMECGEWPRVKYNYILREGLPEEEIMAYAKEYHPTLIVMGTRGKNQKNADLIGSVTGEVIEQTKMPLLAIPEHVPFNNLSVIQRIAFAISFNQRDILAFDKFVDFFKEHPEKIQIQLFNISTSRNEWNDIRLSGLNEYLKKQYPDLKIAHTVLNDGDLLDAIETFVEEKQIDMIAFSTYRRSMITRIFNPSLARKMLFHSNTPLLVIPI